MQQLEQKLEDLLVNKAPYKLPESAKQSLAQFIPWLTLIGGVVMLWMAWQAYQAASWIQGWSDLASQISAYYNVGYGSSVSPLLWVSLGILIVEAVMYFAAFPALSARKKAGWNILFWVALINLVQGVVNAVATNNLGSVIASLISSAIGMYLLFQIRSVYTGAKPVASAGTPPTPPAS